jgi:hypothetical protein
LTKEIVLDGLIRGPVVEDGRSALELVLVIAIDPHEFIQDLSGFVGHTVVITITARLQDLG